MIYVFEQDSIGGFYLQDKDLGEYVVIEAKNGDIANRKAEKIGVDWDDFCECCGYRWEPAKEYATLADVPRSVTTSKDVRYHLYKKHTKEA